MSQLDLIRFRFPDVIGLSLIFALMLGLWPAEALALPRIDGQVVVVVVGVRWEADEQHT